LCLAEYSDTIADTTVSYEASEEAETGTENVTLSVRDVITTEPIKNATVRVFKGGVIFEGVTDFNGDITVPELVKGETYDVKITAEGYFSSGEDYLNNDSFTVPA
jgi:hypothetical protein